MLPLSGLVGVFSIDFWRSALLLVSFHGGSGGICNLYAYDTSGSTPSLNSKKALQNASLDNAELRGMVYANSLLYVVNGARSASDIGCFTPPAQGASKYHFDSVGQFLGPSLNQSGQYQNAIGHPYALLFAAQQSGSQPSCYVSNQDTNVVAQAAVASGSKSASIAKGWHSAYLSSLTGICPKEGCVFLDGTFAGSQDGALPDAAVQATNIPAANGGLAVSFSGGATADASGKSKSKSKVQNSVRDLAVWGEILLICDEPSRQIRLYSLSDGTYLGASLTLAASPTHLAIFASGLYVSAGDQLFWSALSSSLQPQSLCFGSVLTAPNGNKVGGVTFDSATNTAYVAFQDGTGTTGTGSIYSYSLGAQSSAPPQFGSGTLVDSKFADTPEFLLYLDL